MRGNDFKLEDEYLGFEMLLSCVSILVLPLSMPVILFQYTALYFAMFKPTPYRRSWVNTVTTSWRM